MSVILRLPVLRRVVANPAMRPPASLSTHQSDVAPMSVLALWMGARFFAVVLLTQRGTVPGARRSNPRLRSDATFLRPIAARPLTGRCIVFIIGFRFNAAASAMFAFTAAAAAAATASAASVVAITF